MAASLTNLFEELPSAPLAAEQFLELFAQPGLRIERIVSTGQASPPDFWYEPGEGEWVILLQGGAALEMAGEAGVRQLKPGDFLNIPPGQRHRVAWTAPDQTTVWLAIHYNAACPQA